MSRTIDVLMIRGAPGVGKSTLGRRLRRALSSGAVIEVDNVRAMIAQVDWTSRTHHDVALEVALTAVKHFVALGQRPAVLIDTFSRSRLTQVQIQLDGEKLHHATISLWLEPGALACRLEARTSGFKEWKPSRILNEEVLLNRYPCEQFIDATALGRDATLEFALKLLNLGHKEEGAT